MENFFTKSEDQLPPENINHLVVYYENYLAQLQKFLADGKNKKFKDGVEEEKAMHVYTSTALIDEIKFAYGKVRSLRYTIELIEKNNIN